MSNDLGRNNEISIMHENKESIPGGKMVETAMVPVAMTEYAALRSEILKRIELMIK